MKALKHTLLAGFLVLVAAAVIIAGEDSRADDSEAVKPESIQWVAFDVGLERAEKENKHVFVDFTAKWCGYCKKMDRETFSKPEVIDMLNEKFIPVKVDGDSKDTLDIKGYKITEANLTKTEFGVRGYPTFWFLTPEGSKLGNITGYRPPNVMMEAFEFVSERKYDTTGTQQPQEENK